MEKQIHVTDICYVDPPYRSAFWMALDRRYCELEKSLFYHHCQELLIWEREWATFNREAPHNFVGLPLLVRPPALPPMVDGPRPARHVIID